MSVMSLRDGSYLATCKERNALSAAMNGHSAVWPRAQCTVTKGVAVFYRDGKEVWSCNAAYAEVHFKIERIN
nr:hypothetical protein [Burkholderia sp. THE68]